MNISISLSEKSLYRLSCICSELCEGRSHAVKFLIDYCFLNDNILIKDKSLQDCYLDYSANIANGSLIPVGDSKRKISPRNKN